MQLPRPKHTGYKQSGREYSDGVNNIVCGKHEKDMDSNSCAVDSMERIMQSVK